MWVRCPRRAPLAMLFYLGYLAKMVRKPYIEIFLPGHVMADTQGKILLHRFIMSVTIGRPLTFDETVHHKDHNGANNNPTNLELMTKVEHGRHHAKPGRPWPQFKCPVCGTPFRRRTPQVKIPCCSKSCSAIRRWRGTARKPYARRLAAHGKYPRYRAGCRCRPCSAANNRRMKAYRNSKNRN